MMCSPHNTFLPYWSLEAFILLRVTMNLLTYFWIMINMETRIQGLFPPFVDSRNMDSATNLRLCQYTKSLFSYLIYSQTRSFTRSWFLLIMMGNPRGEHSYIWIPIQKTLVFVFTFRVQHKTTRPNLVYCLYLNDMKIHDTNNY